MSRNYDNWEKLVGAVLRREKDRQLAYCESFSTCYSADLSSRFSFDSSAVEDADFRFNPFVGDVHLPAVNSGQNILFSRSVMDIEYEELQNAVTMVLGKGRFGTVYKGYIDEHYAAAKPGYGIAVAVKELKYKSYQQNEEWMYEIKSCSSHRHPNLVTLIGCSFEIDTHYPVLAFELMPKGNLANQLFKVDESLSWATRIKVALGVARALAFLHGLEKPFIHGNIRSSKIFLDGDFNAKLRGFDGILSFYEDPFLSPKVSELHPSALFSADPYHPIIFSNRDIDLESDVYSFGVVLLELMLGLPAFDVNRPSEERLLTDKVRSHFTNRKELSLIMDTRLKGQYPPNEAYEVVRIALKCVDLTAKLRPSMAKVVVALEKLQKPSKARRVLDFSGAKFLRYKL